MFICMCTDHCSVQDLTKSQCFAIRNLIFVSMCSCVQPGNNEWSRFVVEHQLSIYLLISSLIKMQIKTLQIIRHLIKSAVDTWKETGRNYSDTLKQISQQQLVKLLRPSEELTCYTKGGHVQRRLTQITHLFSCCVHINRRVSWCQVAHYNVAEWLNLLSFRTLSWWQMRLESVSHSHHPVQQRTHKL